MGVLIKPKAKNDGNVNKINLLSSEKAHEILGHPDGQRTYATAKKLGWTIKNYEDLTN